MPTETEKPDVCGGRVMAKFIITWNAGFGESAEIVQAQDEDAALRMAWERWNEEAQTNADYGAEPYDSKRAFVLDILPDEDEA
jgi:hypothetical protein